MEFETFKEVYNLRILIVYSIMNLKILFDSSCHGIHTSSTGTISTGLQSTAVSVFTLLLKV